MNPLTKVTKGKAVLTPDGLRCRAPRDKESAKLCNKLLARRSEHAQLAGEFLCPRCGQIVEVEISY